MAKNRNNLKARIRRGTGNPDLEVVTEADLDSFIDEAIEEISRHAPAWCFSFFTTVTGQSEYSLAAGIYDVCFCFPIQGLLASETFGAGFEALDYLVEGATYDVELYKYERFVDDLRDKDLGSYYDWEFNPLDQKLYLITPDISAGTKVYYVGLKKWTFETIPDRFERYIDMYGVYRALEMYGRRQRRQTAISHLGTQEPWDRSSEMLTDSRRVKADFDEYMLIEGKKMAVFLGD